MSSTRHISPRPRAQCLRSSGHISVLRHAGRTWHVRTPTKPEACGWGGAVFPARMTRATKNSDPHIALCVKRCLTAVVKTSHCLSKRKQKAENYDPGESSSFSKLSVRRFWGSAHCRALCPCPSSLHLCRAESAPQVRSLRSELESSGSAGQKPQVSAVLVFDAPSPLRKGAVPWDA